MRETQQEGQHAPIIGPSPARTARKGLPPALRGARPLRGAELAYASPTPTWLDATHLLVVGPERGYRRTDGVMESSGPDHAYAVDLATGGRRVYAPAEAMFTRGRGVPVPGRRRAFIVDSPSDFVPSKGRRWLLARKTGENPPWLVLPSPLRVGTATHGPLARRWTLPGDLASRPVAYPGGDRWIDVVRAPGLQVLLFDADRAEGGGTLRVEPAPGAEDAARKGWIEANLGLLADGRVLVRLGAPEGVRHLALRLQGSRALAFPFGTPHEDDVLGVNDALLSPDGRRLAYRSRRATLSVSEPDGGHVVDLVEGVGAHSFAWSPDSRRLLFARDKTPWCVDVPPSGA